MSVIVLGLRYVALCVTFCWRYFVDKIYVCQQQRVNLQTFILAIILLNKRNQQTATTMQTKATIGDNTQITVM